MKLLTVFHRDGKWFGQDIAWRKSGSGSYRDVTGIEIPQSRAAIENFAAENAYKIEWRGPVPAADPPPAPVAEATAGA